ncbi:hypothetical protein [Streptosporangium sp. NPDC048865]|uniref:hypothetical protein n=1 Tax=Streptosporangium sp. NPDC048865 TaxID=3155766 RepID=UPI003449A143
MTWFGPERERYMKKLKSMLGSAVLVLATTGTATTLVAQPAYAHEGHWSKSRSGCVYSGGLSSDHRYAWTVKNSGSCSGHAYLRVYYNETNINLYLESHAADVVSRSGNFCPTSWCRVYHKSQSSDSWGQSH